MGKRADERSRVRYSSSFRLAGSWTVFCGFEGVLGEVKNAKRDVDVEAGFDAGEILLVDSVLGSVGLFFNFAGGRSGEGSREGILDGGEPSCSMIGNPTWTGADDPVNQDARPRDRSSTFITPSLSPVSVGMKPSSPSITLHFSGLLLLRSGDFDIVLGVRNEGSKAVRLL